jgi:pseudouridine-5'-phosphate glycosidase
MLSFAAVPDRSICAAEIAQALAAGGPVVALESTVIAHGLPQPLGLEVAQEMEAAVRTVGAVPATIAVIGGRLRVGLTPGELEGIASGGAVKAAASDLGFAIAAGKDAATTVSATALAAARAGIAIMATGGIGGVHRGDSWDVSQDLTVLGRERVAVVCSGAKSILDLERTLEVLETLGVPVIGYGTDELPAFYVRASGLRLDHRLDTPADLAGFLDAHWRGLGMTGGCVVAQPVAEAFALEGHDLSVALESAERDAFNQKIRGKALTPFLLRAIAESTDSRSLAANRALLIENAKLAASTAVAWSKRGG